MSQGAQPKGRSDSPDHEWCDFCRKATQDKRSSYCFYYMPLGTESRGVSPTGLGGQAQEQDRSLDITAHSSSLQLLGAGPG